MKTKLFNNGMSEFESLNKDQTGRVSCKVLKNDRVFVELIGRSGALKIISHFIEQYIFLDIG